MEKRALATIDCCMPECKINYKPCGIVLLVISQPFNRKRRQRQDQEIHSLKQSCDIYSLFF